MITGTGTYLDEPLEDDAARSVPLPSPGAAPTLYRSDPPDGFASWREFFDGIRASMSEEAAVPPSVMTPLEAEVNPSEAGLGRSIASILAKLRAAGWGVRVQRVLVHHSAAYYADDSGKKPGEEQPANRRGDLKTPAHEKLHWYVDAWFKPVKLGLSAHWMEEPTPKGARGFKFQSAHLIDPFGMPKEFFVDYERIDKRFLESAYPTRGEQERRRAMARAQDLAYNDGASWHDTRAMVKSSKEMELWLEEALALTAIAQNALEAASGKG